MMMSYVANAHRIEAITKEKVIFKTNFNLTFNKLMANGLTGEHNCTSCIEAMKKLAPLVTVDKVTGEKTSLLFDPMMAPPGLEPLFAKMKQEVEDSIIYDVWGNQFRPRKQRPEFITYGNKKELTDHIHARIYTNMVPEAATQMRSQLTFVPEWLARFGEWWLVLKRMNEVTGILNTLKGKDELILKEWNDLHKLLLHLATYAAADIKGKKAAIVAVANGWDLTPLYNVVYGEVSTLLELYGDKPITTELVDSIIPNEGETRWCD